MLTDRPDDRCKILVMPYVWRNGDGGITIEGGLFDAAESSAPGLHVSAAGLCLGGWTPEELLAITEELREYGATVYGPGDDCDPLD